MVNYGMIKSTGYIFSRADKLSFATYYDRQLRLKNYELKDHLGNIRMVFQDFRFDGAVPDYWPLMLRPLNYDPPIFNYPTKLDIASVYDYYPFGMLKPGRYFEDTWSRYGLNGMEKDDDIKGEGNSYDFGARMYDPRLGRFFSLEPLASSSPDYSPYLYAGNCPITFIDNNGEVEKYYIIKYSSNGQFKISYLKTTLYRYIGDDDLYFLGIRTSIRYELNKRVYYIQMPNQKFDEHSTPCFSFGEDGVNYSRYESSFLKDPVGWVEQNNWFSDQGGFTDAWTKSLDVIQTGAQIGLFMGAGAKANFTLAKNSFVTNPISTTIKAPEIEGPTGAWKASTLTKATTIDEIFADPKRVWGMTKDEIKQMIPEGWIRQDYGYTGKGFNYFDPRSGDRIVFEQGGRHKADK